MSPTNQTVTPAPRHVAIIMDGNGRWARERGWPRARGHREGAESVRSALRSCRRAGVRYLTLYAFSKENWKRPRTEINYLMGLLRRFLREQEAELHEHGVRLRAMGSRQDLPAATVREIERVENATAKYDRHLIVALSYGGRDEIAAAARRLALKVATGELAADDITVESFARHLYLPDVPDPDLIIRTSGEMRLSNFLLWQAAYSELYVTETFWPDFREPQFAQALESYSRRARRFGGLEARQEEGDDHA